MADIAKALHRPASYPTKFFGCVLGTMAKIDDANNKYLINGAHGESKGSV